MRSLEGRLVHDDLTGALTRRAFLDQGQSVIDDLGAGTRQVAVLMVDVDHFKRVNDTHGHAAGDELLVEIAVAAAECLRDSDMFGRLGGEEFSVVLPGVSLVMGTAVAERIREQIAEAVIVRGETSVRVTASIGIAHTTRRDLPLTTLLEAADQALYRAKAAGRDRIVVDTSISTTPTPKEARQLGPRRDVVVRPRRASELDEMPVDRLWDVP